MMKKIFSLFVLLTVFVGANASETNGTTVQEELLINGDAEKTWEELGLANVAHYDSQNNYKVCVWAKEKGHRRNESNRETFPAEIISEADGNHVFICRAQIADTEGEASAWDNQIWFQSPCSWNTGEKFKLSFRYKASKEVRTNTQVHKQTPGDYLYWQAIGDIVFKTEWQTFESEVTVASEADGMWSIAFNLNPYEKEAVDFYIDDISWCVVEKNANSDTSLQINEIMQSNIDCVFDDLNDYPDSWIELYNPGTQADNLSNYKIGLSKNADKAWRLSSVNIDPNGFAMVYCDKEATNNHTDFRLESERGGSIYLFKNNEIVDSYTNIPEQPSPNIAYGRKNEGSEELGFQFTPTPLKSNCGTICSQVLGEPIFDKTGYVGTSSKRITLHLSMPEGTPEGAVIRYTTDGTEPTENSTLYQNSISFATSKVIRAKIFCDGCLSPRSSCQSYINHNRDITLPVISIVTDQANFYDNKKGIYVDGTYSSSKKNFEYDWRRPINIECFMPGEEESVINQLCETRISGGQSRNAQLKSLIVYANKRFGKKRLKYEFFPTQRPGLNKFKSIMLRNSGNDFDYLYFRDAAIQRSMAEHVDLDWQAWRPAIFYLNGTYMGMLNIRERSNEDNVWENYDGLEDIDMFENFGELKAGDWTDFNSFKDFYANDGHTYAEYDELMDIEEFQNYNLMQIFFNNQDWPGNNIVQWKPRTEGGKWRWIAKDTDFGLGLYGSSANYNTIEWLYDNNYDSNRDWANTEDATRLFRRLMDIDQFKWEFLDKLVVYTGNFLSATNVKALLDEMYNEIDYEYPYHRQLINQWWPNHKDELNKAKNWMNSRTNYFFNHLIKKYGLSSTLTGKINNELTASQKEMLSITVNDIALEKGYFDGRFFSGRKLNLNGTCVDESKYIKGWTVTSVKNGQTTKETLDGSNVVYTPANLSSVTFNAILEDATGIEELIAGNMFNVYALDGQLIIESDTNENIAVYDINGRQILRQKNAKNIETPVRRGVYIVKCGDKSKKIVVE